MLEEPTLNHPEEVSMVKYRLLAVFVALLTLALVGSIAGASTIPDPQIFICQSCAAPPGGDPNIITNTAAFDVGVAGNFTLQDPLLIIIGVYDGGSATVSFSGCAIPSDCPDATLTTYGLSADTASFTSSSTGDAYFQLGLAAGGSENFGNWSTADQAAGLAAPTSFTLEAFQLPVSLVSGTTISIDTTAPIGSFIIAYDCEVTKKGPTGSSTGCAKPGNIGQTPFTNAGLINTGPIHKVPEPAGLAMLGSGLLLIGGLLRRKLRTNA